MHTLYIEIESLSEKLESRSPNSIFFFSLGTRKVLMEKKNVLLQVKTYVK